MKITCDIIRDLLPLYVDDVLSEDSRKLVREHLENCTDCQAQLRQMEGDLLLPEASEKRADMEKETFLKIKRRLRLKQVMAAVICGVCLLGIFAGGHYLYYERKVYIPYEETGFRVEEDKLYADRNWYGRLYGIVSKDQKVEFLIEKETLYTRKEYPAEELPEDRLVMDFAAQSSEGGDTETTIPTLERVYYLPEEYKDFVFSEEEETAEKELEELEEKSILLWKKNGNKAETDAQGRVYDAAGACIGTNEEYHYVYDPDAVG